jgi:hypothetical protein
MADLLLPAVPCFRPPDQSLKQASVMLLIYLVPLLFSKIALTSTKEQQAQAYNAAQNDQGASSCLSDQLLCGSTCIYQLNAELCCDMDCKSHKAPQTNKSTVLRRYQQRYLHHRTVLPLGWYMLSLHRRHCNLRFKAGCRLS